MDDNPTSNGEEDHHDSPEKDNAATSSDPPVKKPGSKGAGRKRTKSGCLTCRKRRIKCGEERPTCQNCTKSKRKCEGYNQRVVFKDPMSTYRPTWAGTSDMVFATRGGPQRVNKKVQPSQATNNPPPIAPKPTGVVKETTSAASQSRPLEFIHDGFPRNHEHNYQARPPPTAPYQAPQPPSQPPPITQSLTDGAVLPPVSQVQVQGQPLQHQPAHYDFKNLTKLETSNNDPAHNDLSPLDWEALQGSNSQQSGNEIYVEPSKRFLTRSYAPSNWDIGRTFSETPYTHSPEYDGQATASTMQGAPIAPYASTSQVESHLSSEHYDMMDDDEDEDDPWDVVDDEMQLDEESQFDHLRHNDLGAVVALQATQHDRGLQMRSMLDFIDRPDMLATYAPSIQSSPLRDPMAARLFCHFVNVTAPIISMYERHPANPSVIFQGSPVPKSQQHIWTYVFPTLALRNSALLHAMLALASLHVSQLQNVPVTKSLKHYHISLRRVAKSLGHDAQRTKTATLAAAMLLGFYELWCADHQKWSNHLLGAKHLLVQINFANMAKHAKLERIRQREQERAREAERRRQNGSTYVDDRTHFQNYVDEVDENLVGMLMGKRLRYDEFGQILDDEEGGSTDTGTFTEKDMTDYEIKRDMFWWYAKQDVYQSILGGGRLFLPYDLWSRCPPRAPIGRLNATYGTYDHLMILMARVADFASKDLVRKRKTAKAQGGWRPPPGMGPPGPPPGPQGPSMRSPMNMGPPPANMMPAGRGMPHGSMGPSQMPHPQMAPGEDRGPPQMGGPPGGPPRGPPQMPNFPGMLPTFGEAKLPMGFDQRYREKTPPSATSTTSEGFDLETQRLEAEEEWQEIRSMFTVLVDHFGEDFEPLGPEYTAPIQTPFGPALQYRTYGIAGIWMGYYMGLIACHRAHPSMPPAAMMAAGIAAPLTGHMANEIGRIAAGIAPDINDDTKHVSPLIGAGLIESAAPLFIAAVQYQNPDQRLWTATRLTNIARLSGWQTANAIATGCETSWIKTGEAGMGPPWTRKVVEKSEKEKGGKQSIWDNGRRTDRAGQDRDYEGALVVARTDRVYYALGILGLEKDFDRLEVGAQGGA